MILKIWLIITKGKERNIMKKIILLLCVLTTTNVFAEVNYITCVVERPTLSLLIGRYNEQKLMDTLNKKLLNKLKEVNATKIDYISYTNIQTPISGKSAGDMAATAWYEK